MTRGLSGPSGQWWNAYITDKATKVESKIGGIKTDSDLVSITLPANFMEYLGESVPGCGDVPVSAVTWYQSVLEPADGAPPHQAVYLNSSRGECTGGLAEADYGEEIPVVKGILGGAIADMRSIRTGGTGTPGFLKSKPVSVPFFGL